MARFKSVRLPQRLLVATAFWLMAWGLSAAQSTAVPTFDATRLLKPVELNSDWRLQAGDDPSWARPDLDDSHWTSVDISKDLKTYFPPGRPEIVWYRLHLRVTPGDHGLALRQVTIARAWEVYVNGEKLASAGQITPLIRYTWNASVLSPIPDRVLAAGSLVIAVRVHIDRTEWVSDSPGLTAGNLTLGQYEALYSSDWLSILGKNLFGWLDRLLDIGLGVVALALFASQRRQKEYLWIAAMGLLTLAEGFEPAVSLFRNIPFRWEVLTDCLRVFTPYVFTALYFAFIRKRIGWGWRIFLILAGILNAFSAIQPFYLNLPLIVQFFSNLPFIILLSVVVPIMLAVHWRRGNREAGILLIPIVLFSLYIYAEVGFEILYQFPNWRETAQHALNTIDRFPAGPFYVSLSPLSDMLSTLAFAIIILLRSTTMSRRQAILDGELAAAKEVQKVLLSEHPGTIPGFTVNSVYEPARQVGGDFFQVIQAGEGAFVMVVGDVAGKGLPAAMLVSVLVGAICGLSEFTKDPVELLTGLNERLVGRSGGGFATALAAHVAVDGRVTIANAGHLSPFLDGREVELPGALPLGVMSGTVYETCEFYLPPGSRLAFFSDGVVEAQNTKGELFGFERAKAISTRPASEIVRSAQLFGQEDDITVVTIEREEAIASAA